MINNNSITYYHKELDNNKIETWKKTVFKDVWVFSGKNSTLNKGYENENNVNVRIPMRIVKDTTIFELGDIIAIGIRGNITKQSDLNGTEFYNVTSVNINSFGGNQHIHLGGK